VFGIGSRDGTNWNRVETESESESESGFDVLNKHIKQGKGKLIMQNGNKTQGNSNNGRLNRFEDLIAWQEARALTREIYSMTSCGALKQDFGLRDQVRRAAVSVMSNIAEGFERVGVGEKIQFMNIARASCAEVKSLLYVCLDNGWVESPVASSLQARCSQIGRLTSGLIRSASRKRMESQSESRSADKRPKLEPGFDPDTDSDSDSDSYPDSDSSSAPPRI